MALQVGSIPDAAGTRETLRRLLEEKGTSRARQLAQGAGVHITTAIYHLRRLERAGMARQENGIWTTPNVTPAARQLGPSMTKAIRELRRTGPMDHTHLARVLGISRPAVTALVRRLHDRGLVQIQAQGRRKVLAIPAWQHSC